MPARLAVGRVATPEVFVFAVPTEIPCSEKGIALPSTDPLEESVACRLVTVPPYVPLALLTVRPVADPPLPLIGMTWVLYTPAPGCSRCFVLISIFADLAL